MTFEYGNVVRLPWLMKLYSDQIRVDLGKPFG